jgi:hypothetical protein
MLLWTALICLFSANLAVSQFVRPGVLAEYDPNTALKPMKDKLEGKDSSDNVHLIRGLLMVRQSGCPTGYGECTNPAGRSVLQPLPPSCPPPTRVLVLVICLNLPFHAFDAGMLNMETVSHRCCPMGGSCCQTDGGRPAIYPTLFVP